MYCALREVLLFRSGRSKKVFWKVKEMSLVSHRYAVPFGMPKCEPKNNKGPVNLMLPKPLIAKFREAAAVTRRTLSAYIEIALENQLKTDGFLLPTKKDSPR
jgi:hypothetical protein